MRAIKFRGKSVSDGRWVFGSLILLNGDYWIQSFDASRLSRVIPESVGQFVCEINGVEIYEGDIVKHQRGRNGVVEWIDNLSLFDTNYSFCATDAELGVVYSQMEVIGNTTDNKYNKKEEA